MLFNKYHSLFEIKMADLNVSKLLKVKSDGLINAQDRQYMMSYALEQYKELINRETLGIFKNHFNYSPEFNFLYGNSMMRAYIINKLFGVAAEPALDMVDKGIVFQAINLMDRYFLLIGTKQMKKILSKPEENPKETMLLKKWVSYDESD
jgi:hypothetical protein